MFEKQDCTRDEYISLLILLYFREHRKKYSLTELADTIGCSVIRLSDYIENLVEEGYLEYRGNLLAIDIYGINILSKYGMDYYSDDTNISELYESEKWDEEKIYIVHEFSKKLWRGNN